MLRRRPRFERRLGIASGSAVGGAEELSLPPRPEGRLAVGDECAAGASGQCARHAVPVRAGREAGTSGGAGLERARGHIGRIAGNGRRPGRERIAELMSDIDPKLLEILVCPVTKGPLIYDRERQELISKLAGLAYPIRNGVPIMLAGEARELSDEERIGK